MLMISGDKMKKYLKVKQKHRYTNEKNVMFEGHGRFEKKGSVIHISYVENDQKTTVKVSANEEELHLVREGEFQTDLHFRHKQKTQGSVLSEFGTITLEIYTHKYIRKENVIALEYDILSGGEVTDGYRILWIVKEEQV